jgi:hypothetical protein
MWQNIVNIAKTASAFLQNGKAPPNTTPEFRKAMEKENHLSSKKFFIIFTSVLMLGVLYYSSVGILLTINMPEHVTAFVTLLLRPQRYLLLLLLLIWVYKLLLILDIIVLQMLEYKVM